MPRYEGVWTCAQCSNGVEIPGSIHNCPSCGDPHNSFQDPSEKWYLSDNPREITDPDELARGDVGPNWNCGNCKQSNAGDQGQCTKCLQWRSTDDHISPVTTYENGDVESATEVSDSDSPPSEDGSVVDDDSEELPQAELPFAEHDTSAASFTGKEDTHEAFPPTRREAFAANVKRAVTGVVSAFVANKRRVASALAAIGLMTGVVTVYNDYIATHPVDVTVEQLSWERTVEIEELRTLEESDWYVPSGGRLIRTTTEIRSYREVFSHNETRTRQVSERKKTGSHDVVEACGSTTVDKGNGQFDVETTYCTQSVDEYTTVYTEEEYDVPIYDRVPVYDTQYVYEIDRWVTHRYDPAKGESNPYWPTSTLSGKQRIGDELSEKYTVVLVDVEGRKFSRTVDLTTWSRMSKGKVLKGEETRQGDLRSVAWN